MQYERFLSLAYAGARYRVHANINHCGGQMARRGACYFGWEDGTGASVVIKYVGVRMGVLTIVYPWGLCLSRLVTLYWGRVGMSMAALWGNGYAATLP